MSSIRCESIDLLLNIREKTGISILFISHDLGVVARIADRVAVMYAGKIVELGTAEDVFYDPRHPYTWGLLSALPSFADESGGLKSIPGMPPSMIGLPKGDAFAISSISISAEDMCIGITISVGIYTILEKALEAAEIIKLADQNMYKSKFNGKNRITSSAG